MRVLLFTGTGGAGTSTVAAATAVHAARCGIKTLLASLDGAAPGVEADGLSVVRAGSRDRPERSWHTLADHLNGILDDVGADPLLAEDLTVLPGAEEILTLLDLRDLAEGDHELLVADCGPATGTLRMLALPEAVVHGAGRALPVERRILRALATGARANPPAGASEGAFEGAFEGAMASGPPRDHLVDAVDRLLAELTGVRRVLDSPGTSVRLVLTPESVAVARGRSLLTALALYGYPVDGVVMNRIVPGEGDDPWRRARARAQEPLLEEAGTRFRPVPVLTAGEAPAEPLGAGALADLGEELYGPPRAGALLAPPAPAARSRVERAKVPDGTGEKFTLVLPLPLATRGDVALARVGDDLALTVAGHRRVLALPSALRRCVVAGAGLDDGALRVRFRPDPALWPLP